MPLIATPSCKYTLATPLSQSISRTSVHSRPHPNPNPAQRQPEPRSFGGLQVGRTVARLRCVCFDGSSPKQRGPAERLRSPRPIGHKWCCAIIYLKSVAATFYLVIIYLNHYEGIYICMGVCNFDGGKKT